MINLLPPDVKESYDYARRNVHMINWVLLMAFAVVGLVILGTGGFIYMQKLSDSYANQVSSLNSSLQAQKLPQIQSQAKDISGSLKLAVQVLSREVLFSQLLERMGTVTPTGVRLTGLDIVQTTGALDITADATDYATATQLQANLSDPKNKIFSKADTVSIACDSSKPTYPCTITIRALFSKDNPFLFINAGGAKP